LIYIQYNIDVYWYNPGGWSNSQRCWRAQIHLNVSLKGCRYVVLQFPARLAHTTWAMENLQELRSSKSKPKRRNRSEIEKSDFFFFPLKITQTLIKWIYADFSFLKFSFFLFFFFLNLVPQAYCLDPNYEFTVKTRPDQ
jgi:hypothetical protein